MDANDIKKLAKTRWKNCVKRCFNLAISPPNYADIESILMENYAHGFRCGYCLRKLEISSSYPYASAPSIEHIIPLSEGGTNKKENMIAVCHCCNIVKGTMPLDLFMAELSAINAYNPGLLDKILESKLRGALKSKLIRLENEGVLK